MTVVLILLALIIGIVLVLIFGGAEQRKRRKEMLKEEAKREKLAKKEMKKRNKEARKESKKFVDIFNEENQEDIQEGVTTDAQNYEKEVIDPSELSEMLKEDDTDAEFVEKEPEDIEIEDNNENKENYYEDYKENYHDDYQENYHDDYQEEPGNDPFSSIEMFGETESNEEGVGFVDDKDELWGEREFWNTDINEKDKEEDKEPENNNSGEIEIEEDKKENKDDKFEFNEDFFGPMGDDDKKDE